ncbi:biliverdin-producing heme oxygenase [Georgenia sp. MJ206]|uniref:biliverdin-producing heme oxygenase n=1 Tax=Georgenia wangjunii TaxID=3117730 RepID=UPI002F26B5C5
MADVTSGALLDPPAPALAQAVPPFSTTLRLSTRDVHEDAENVGFMKRLFAGEMPREGYAALVTQHWFVYTALEERGRALAADPVAGAFITADLERLPSIEADLTFLVGADWRARIEPLAATARYAERIAALDKAGPFVAHHYTRYLGDLSGGLAIGRILARTYDLAPGEDGVRFYHFPAIPKPKLFKDGYRRALDEAPWSEREREQVLAEARLAFELNAGMTVELGQHFPA